MKHSLEELFNESYRYFPRGEPFPATGARETPQYRNQQEAHDRASTSYPAWRALLRRIEERFPKEQFPGAGIEDRCPFLQKPGLTPWNRGYSGSLWLPKSLREVERRIGFQVSFVVPYSMIYVWRDIGPAGEFFFEPLPEERPFVDAVKEEIERSYPEHEWMPPEVGLTLVPEVVESGNGPGSRATIYDCLFSDSW